MKEVESQRQGDSLNNLWTTIPRYPIHSLASSRTTRSPSPSLPLQDESEKGRPYYPSGILSSSNRHQSTQSPRSKGRPACRSHWNYPRILRNSKIERARLCYIATHRGSLHWSRQWTVNIALPTYKSALPMKPPTGSAIILTNMMVVTFRVTKLITGSIICASGTSSDNGIKWLDRIPSWWENSGFSWDRWWNMDLRNYRW